MHRLKLVALSLCIAVLFTVMGMVAVITPDALAQGITNFSNVVVTGNLIAGDNVVAGENLTVGGVNMWERQTPIAVTMTGYITPTGSYQPLTSAGTVGTSHVATTTLTAGSLLLLINETDTTITISDTADLLLGDNRALGQNDTLLLLHTGTDWVEVSYTNN